MRIGWTGYTSLRRDLLAPINSTDLYITALPQLGQMVGEPVHWMPLKRLREDCEKPPYNADDDEKYCHQSVIHYGDCFKPLCSFVNGAPTSQRFEALLQHQFSPTQFKYQVPYLDVLVIESSSQMGGSYMISELARLLYQVNPNIGFIVIDLDCAGPAIMSKIRRWHPRANERIVYATYHPTIKEQCQVFFGVPHLEYREQPPSIHGDDVAYVGNDYLRREAMIRLMRGPRFHIYGKIKPDFEENLRQNGVNQHGPFVATRDYTVEQVYRQHGFAINVLRSEYYGLNLVTIRSSEVPRAGVLMFSDSKMKMARPLQGDWFMVNTCDELLWKVNYCIENPQFRLDWIAHQQMAARHYLASQRYSETLYNAAVKLCEGPLQGRWHHTLYNDLLAQSGIPVWSNQ